MSDEEILKEVDKILDGIAEDVREYAKVALKHIRKMEVKTRRISFSPSRFETMGFIEYHGGKAIAGPLTEAAFEELLESHLGRNKHLVDEIIRMVDHEESK